MVYVNLVYVVYVNSVLWGYGNLEYENCVLWVLNWIEIFILIKNILVILGCNLNYLGCGLYLSYLYGPLNKNLCFFCPTVYVMTKKISHFLCGFMISIKREKKTILPAQDMPKKIKKCYPITP